MVAPHFDGLYYSLQVCCEGSWLQACRKIDVKKEHISCLLRLREMLLSLQTAFNLVSTAVVCAVLEGISGLELSSDTVNSHLILPVLLPLLLSH